MDQHTESPMFKEFMSAGLIVKYPCNRNACERGTLPRVMTAKEKKAVLMISSHSVTKMSTR